MTADTFLIILPGVEFVCPLNVAAEPYCLLFFLFVCFSKKQSGLPVSEAEQIIYGRQVFSSLVIYLEFATYTMDKPFPSPLRTTVEGTLEILPSTVGGTTEQTLIPLHS